MADKQQGRLLLALDIHEQIGHCRLDGDIER